MSAFLSLTKQLIKNTFKPHFADQKEKKKYIVTLVALIVGLGLPYVLVISSSFTLFEVAAENSLLAEILSTVFLSGQVATMFLTLFAYVNIMYFSKDNEFLFTLPIKSTTIFWAKLINVLLLEMIFSAFILVPILVISAFAIISGGLTLSIGYIVMSILSIILLPLMAILIIAILSYPLMMIIKFFKKRPMLGAVIGIILIVAFYIAIYTPMLLASGAQEMPSGAASGDIADTGTENVENEEAIRDLYTQLMSPFATLGRYSYHTYFLAKSMTSASMLSGFGYAIAFVGIVIVLALIGTILASLIYKKISVGMLEDGGQIKKKKSSSKVVQLGQEKALMKREFNSIFKNSTLFIQAGMMLLLSPILVFFLGKMMGDNAQGLNGKFLSLFVAELMIRMMCASSNIAVIAISREGEGIFSLKTYPLDYKTIVNVKIKLANYFSFATILLSSIAYLLTGNANILAVCGLLAGNTLYAFAMNRYSVYRDLKKPKVHWKNIVEITNNNFSSIIPMIISMIGGIFIMVVGILLALLPINEYLIALIYCVLTMIVSIIYYFPIKSKTQDDVCELFDRIE